MGFGYRSGVLCRHDVCPPSGVGDNLGHRSTGSPSEARSVSSEMGGRNDTFARLPIWRRRPLALLVQNAFSFPRPYTVTSGRHLRDRSQRHVSSLKLACVFCEVLHASVGARSAYVSCVVRASAHFLPGDEKKVFEKRWGCGIGISRVSVSLLWGERTSMPSSGGRKKRVHVRYYVTPPQSRTHLILLHKNGTHCRGVQHYQNITENFACPCSSARSKE